jgi:hypothetical protein
MTSELLVAIDKRISHLQEARALLADFVKIEQISKYRGRGNYFGIPKAAKTAKAASKKMASVTIARRMKLVSKAKSRKKKI